MQPRQFLYLDHPLVRDFLAQTEGGVFDETRQLTNTEGKGGFSVKAGVGPAGAGAEKTKNTRVESELVVKQIAASEFDRLYTHLEEHGLQVFDAVDVSADDLPIRRKDIVEVDARVRVSAGQALVDMFGMAGRQAPLLEEMGFTDNFDANTAKAMQAFAKLNGDQPLPVIASVPGESGLQVALELRRDGVLTENWDAEASVVFKVQRILRPDDRYLVGDPFGGLLKVLPDAQRAEILAQMETGLAELELDEFEVRYPAIVGTPIAIYR